MDPRLAASHGAPGAERLGEEADPPVLADSAVGADRADVRQRRPAKAEALPPLLPAGSHESSGLLPHRLEERTKGTRCAWRDRRNGLQGSGSWVVKCGSVNAC